MSRESIRYGARAAAAGLATVCCIATATAQAPPPEENEIGEISGVVVDAGNLQPLGYAAVTIEPMSDGVLPASNPGSGPFIQGTRSVRTNQLGQYRYADLPPGMYRLHVQRVGYHSSSVLIELGGRGRSRISVGLTVDPIGLDPIQVTTHEAQPYKTPVARGDGYFTLANSHRLAVVALRQRAYLPSDVRAITRSDVVQGVTLGETDLFRAIQRLPGMSSVDDYSADLWTRGATSGQTRVYFDGFPLFNPLHALGLFSGVNSDAIGAAFLHPGVQPVAFGGAAAGTLDLRSRRGDGDMSGVAAISLASGRVALDGENSRFAWMVSGRRSYLDWLSRTAERVSGAENIHVPYNFYDVAQRYDYKLGESTLTLSMLMQRDEVTGNIPDVISHTSADWGGGAMRATLAAPVGAFSTRHTIGMSGFSSRIRRRGTDARSNSIADNEEIDPSSNDVLYVAIKGEIEPASGASGAIWSAGYEIARQRSEYRGPLPMQFFYLLPENPFIQRDEALVHGALWAKRRWRPLELVTIETGLRLEMSPAVQNAGRIRAAPRVTARYQMTPELSTSLGIGRTYQYTQALAPAGPAVVDGFRNEFLWVTAGEETPAIRSDIATVGVESWLGPSWIGAANLYLRRSEGMTVPDPKPGYIGDRPLFVVGKSRARGVELSARKLTGRWTASVGYSYGVATTTAAGLTFPAPADRRHTLDATYLLRLAPEWRVGAAFTAASGTPYTRVFTGADCQDALCLAEAMPRVGDPGAFRSVSYRSLDLMMDWIHEFQNWTGGVYLQIRNALGRENHGRYTGLVPRYCPDACVFRDGAEFGRQGRDEFLPGIPMLPLFGFRAAF